MSKQLIQINVHVVEFLQFSHDRNHVGQGDQGWVAIICILHVKKDTGQDAFGITHTFVAWLK